MFHTVVDILLNEPDTSSDMFPMIGMCHMAKVLLLCAGRYLSGSGVDNALTECEVFGRRTLAAVLSSQVKSSQGMFIVSQVLETLAWQAFWRHNGTTNMPVLGSINELGQMLMRRKKT